MVTKINEQLQNMNWLSASILKYGLPFSCMLLGLGLFIHFYNIELSLFSYASSFAPASIGKTSIVIFSEIICSAFLIDYYVKKHSNASES